MTAASSMFIASDDRTLWQQICGWIEPHGWTCDVVAKVGHIADQISDDSALMLIDGRLTGEIIRSTIARIRDLPGFASSLPVIVLAETECGEFGGANDRLLVPVHAPALYAVMETWAGLLEAHDFRDPENPRYRLTRLAGRDRADMLLARFAESLREALAGIDQGQDIKRIAHNITGVAGTMGYASLSKAWLAVDRGDMAGLGSARAAAEDILRALTAQG